MFRQLLTVLLVFMLLHQHVLSQSYYFRHYQVEEGLSNNTVFSCQQDKHGFLWMGTKDGLSRFDGYTFKIFRNDSDDSTSIGDNFIRSMYISTGDTLYAGTRNGLYRYNAVLENFTALYRGPEEIRDIKKDTRGNIWFVAGQTLHRLSETGGAGRKYEPARFFSATSICIDRNGKVWVATSDGQLRGYNYSDDSFSSYNLFDERVPLSSRWIEKIYVTSGNMILAGTSNYGVKSFNVTDHSTKDLLTYNPDRTAIFARDFVQTSANEIWIASESGIFIYNLVTGVSSNLNKQVGNPYTLSDNAVYSLCRDREGGTWAGTYFGGVNYYPRPQVSFEKYFPVNNANSLSGSAVREICEDRFGHLWIGTEDAGLNRLDKKTGAIVQYKPTGTSESISYPNIHGMLVQGNQLWVGTFEHGMDVLDIPKGKVIKHYPGNSLELRSNFIVVLYRTREGINYVGTRQGLYTFNEASGKFRLVAAVPGDCFIHALTEDVNGTLWIGTLGQGMFFINEKSGRSGRFSAGSRNKGSLTSNSVTTLFESRDKQLWIGTEGGGLCRFNAADSSFEAYTLKKGFPSNTIFRVLEDDYRKLWVTTANGLVCLDPRSGKLNIYTTAHGLLSNQFNYNSGYKDSEGTMYFGSAKGLVSFHPGRFAGTEYKAPVLITGLFINDKELRPVAEGSPLKTAVLFTKRVELDHNQSSFSIDFAALSFIAPEMTEYKYITEGLDQDWTYLKTNRKVYFTDLSPGTYTFRVMAGDGSGGWSDQSASITIVIRPPFWASAWAYVLYALAGLALVVLLVRAYHNRMREKTKRKIEQLEHEKEKEIYQAKIDFFTNVAHEIKTPLTLVKAPMEQVAKKAGDNPAFAYDLRIMQRNTDRLVELTNQLLDFRKVETKGFHLNFVSTSITEVLLETYSGFKILADQKGINFSIRTPATAVIAHVDLDSLQKILNNLLYNALNYCRKEAEIELSSAAGMVQLEVSNDGLLIPEESREKIFEPFYRLKHHDNKSGSGIGLALSKSLAELHKGSIEFRVRGDRNVFVLKLPVEQRPA